MAEATACGIAQTGALAEGVDASEFIRHYLSREHRDSRATGCTMAALSVEKLLASLGQKGRPTDVADPAQVRARILDMLSHAVGVIVMSRAYPDDSPLANEMLAVWRDAILSSRNQPGTEKAKSRQRNVG